MKAQEARDIARKFNEEANHSEIVYETIDSAAIKGRYECWVYFDINPDLKAKLESEGYRVGPSTFYRNEMEVRITW